MTQARSAPKAVDDVEARAARGRAARQAVPRSELARWEPGPTRPDPLAVLLEQEQSRLPDLVPLRHERMASSSFAFYRGAAAVMAADLDAGPHTALTVQCCGDAHLANFGGYASPERTLVFDLNDFDETCRGPFEWDVKRLVASFEIAARSRGFSATERRTIALRTAAAYREAMTQFATLGNLAIWYSRLDAQAALDMLRERIPDQAKRLAKVVAKADRRDQLGAFEKLTQVVDGDVRFASDPPILVPIGDLLQGPSRDELSAWLDERMRTYRGSLQRDRRHLLDRYRQVDLARKVVGVGSVGTRCWVVLFIGRDETDPLFLQVKEAQRSVLEPYAGESRFANHGQRVVEGQRLLQTTSDVLLGWTRAEGLDGVTRDYYVRQLWDWKVSARIDTMIPEYMHTYAGACGWTLARAHARSGDPIALAAYLGRSDRFDRALADYATAYADQNEDDHERVTSSPEWVTS